jgi:CheY-like chemotaxis protein
MFSIRHQQSETIHYVCLAVSDNGCGMDKHTIKNIFDPFFTTKEMGKGTGLGLSTVFGIVKQSDGFINVYSEPGQGTTFRIYLPYIDTGEGPLPVEHQPQKAIRQTGVETVLFVDDEQSILDIGQRILNELGYTVIVANSPNEAIQIINKHNDIELLITDIVMPEMNGKDLFKLLASHKPSLKCLYMSGYTADIITKHGLLIDEMRLIAKPFSIDELAIKIRDVLDK